MRLLSLTLDQFRNYEQLDLLFPSGTQVFYGANAQGKTNLLEAIYLCTCARSHRTGRDDELIRHGQSFYRVGIRFLTDQNLEESLSITYQMATSSKPSSRTIKYNGFDMARVSDLMGLFHAIIFAPEDLQIVKGGPAERRRFLDILISRTDRAYFRDLQEYWTILGQRNRLLKHIRDTNLNLTRSNRSKRSQDTKITDQENQTGEDVQLNKKTPDEQKKRTSIQFKMDDYLHLDVWDQKLAEVSSSILRKRLDYAKYLLEYGALSLMHLTSLKEELSVSYRSISGLDSSMSKKEIETYFFNRLKTARDDDIARGSTAQGPHRDDLSFSLNGQDARLYASQGQQRSIVLALKMAELVILSRRTGEKPILLLDDVLSELDASRRHQLLDVISGHQVFITSTDVSMFQPWDGPLHLYAVSMGTVTPEKAVEAKEKKEAKKEQIVEVKVEAITDKKD
ncbi:MAG: DNA replication/repair protein RecF [Clostridiaceae bacterium]|nr:DNA replication/repair protein RecF [Clostridiaceae bacterium]